MPIVTSAGRYRQPEKSRIIIIILFLIISERYDGTVARLNRIFKESFGASKKKKKISVGKL